MARRSRVQPNVPATVEQPHPDPAPRYAHEYRTTRDDYINVTTVPGNPGVEFQTKTVRYYNRSRRSYVRPDMDQHSWPVGGHTPEVDD